MSLTANWSYPTTIRFGLGRVSELAQACPAQGIKRPLLVTDKGLGGLPITQKALDSLDQAGLGRALFCDVDPNPSEINLEAGVLAYRQGGHDGVIAFGGGSGLDGLSAPEQHSAPFTEESISKTPARTEG